MLDRLGRSTLELLELVQRLDRRGVGLQVLTGAGASIDTTWPELPMILTVSATIAEIERDLNCERMRAGMGATKRRGRRVGRPRKLTSHDLDVARQLIDRGRERSDIAAAPKIGVATLRRGLKKKRE